jgi:flavin-dependent dehydrogenase
MREIAIVGGGPAGALCGERLAGAGFRVTIFDERLAWEKPCGGGLTHKAIEAFPFLLDSNAPKTLARRAELIACDGSRATLELEKPVVLYSRKVLNGILLERARAAGCRIVCARVTRADAGPSRVTLFTKDEKYSADFLVVAAGARNSLLPGTAPLDAQDLEMTVGYFIPANGSADGRDATLKIQFLEDFTGYLWSFPRPGHFSVGICAPLLSRSTTHLRRRVDHFVHREQIAEVPLPAAPRSDNGVPAGFFSHVLPAPRAVTLRNRRVAGGKWALIGDAAAWVDPLTGEGLYYAMRSGDLLAQALIAERPEDYEPCARHEFLAELAAAGRMARRFFHGFFLGEWFHVRLVQLLSRSATLRQIAGDLFSGAQNYVSLKPRLRRRAARVFLEVLFSFAGLGPSENRNGRSGPQ